MRLNTFFSTVVKYVQFEVSRNFFENLSCPAERQSIPVDARFLLTTSITSFRGFFVYLRHADKSRFFFEKFRGHSCSPWYIYGHAGSPWCARGREPDIAVKRRALLGLLWAISSFGPSEILKHSEESWDDLGKEEKWFTNCSVPHSHTRSMYSDLSMTRVILDY